ncbi:hypothetical protein B0I35DRAFT_477390 [Stachybotrys elegans]|uniref:Uncharacterized protein n=1 Tax=Stachybotrys elegans TaxID=80388 RepID=A0A8K0SPU6_9HYPO|nr:hypothetical protein B0I35DRAFT_477390 [Stachybotrys elegans]
MLDKLIPTLLLLGSARSNPLGLSAIHPPGASRADIATLAYAPGDVARRGGFPSPPVCLEGQRDGDWSPDPHTFFFPHVGGRGNSWDLCLGGDKCSPHDAAGRAIFDFGERDLVVELLNYRGHGFEDIKLWIQTNSPPHVGSPHYNKHTGHCRPVHHPGPHHHGPSGPLKCYIPYHELIREGPHTSICPINDKGSWIFYIQIEAVIKTHHGPQKVYSRGLNDDICWFSISYACSKCYHHHWPKPPVEETCLGVESIIYGTSAFHAHALWQLADHSHPRTCRGHDGYYHRIPRRALEGSVLGVIELDRNVYGDFRIELERAGPDFDLLIEVDVHDEGRKFVLTEVAVFVDCTGGVDHRGGRNICIPETWQHIHAEVAGFRDQTIRIRDEFRCRSDYFIAIVVKVCEIKGHGHGRPDCHYKRI